MSGTFKCSLSTRDYTKKAKTRAEFGFVFLKDRAVCNLCCENAVCRMSNVKRHFETKHEKTFKDQADKPVSI